MRRPLRLSRKVYRSCLLAALSAALICIGIFAGFAYNQVCLENARNLREEAAYIAQAVELSGVAYLEKLSPEDGSRVTWIAADGQVLYDTWVPAEAMGNHGGRAEVRQALEEGSGQSSRYSDTLAERTNNYALRIADGSVVRFSVTQASNLSLLQSAALPTLAALALVAGLTLLLAARTGRDMVEPINRIDLQAPLESQTYEELRPLVRRIGTQNQQIRDQMKHLTQEHEEQDRYRREFTANVSHELKTPLTSISGYAELIESGMAQGEQAKTFAGEIHKSANRLLTLINDIIRLSQMDAPMPDLKFEPVDLAQIATNTFEQLEMSARKVDVTLQLDAKQAVVEADRQMMDELLYNLCDNAIRYNVRGGSVKLEVRPIRDKVIVCVQDTGIGISPENQEHVFERFYRVDKSRSKATGGTGLGLAIVKHIAVKHNAQIELESELGRGTKISVIFDRCFKA